MGKTILALLIAFAALLWLPAWVQIALFAFGVFLVPHPTVLLIPAIVHDALYAPTGAFRSGNLRMTGIVLALLIIHWLLVTQTRFGTYHDSFQKK